MTYTGYYGGDVGSSFDSSGNLVGSGLYDPWSSVYPPPGIMDYPYNPLAGWGDAYGRAVGTSNPGGVGLVPQADHIWGQGNFVSGLFPTYDTDSLLDYTSQESINNMLTGFGIDGYDTSTDYSSLVQDSYYYYNQGVDTYEQFDSSNAYPNEDIYFDSVMGYADSVADWGSGF